MVQRPQVDLTTGRQFRHRSTQLLESFDDLLVGNGNQVVDLLLPTVNCLLTEVFQNILSARVFWFWLSFFRQAITPWNRTVWGWGLSYLGRHTNLLPARPAPSVVSLFSSVLKGMPLSLSPDLNMRIKGPGQTSCLLTAAGSCYYTDNNAQSLGQNPSGHFVPAFVLTRKALIDSLTRLSLKSVSICSL